jgi:aminotransferase
MRNPINHTIAEMKPSGIRKFFDIVSEMKDAISLGVGEPDFETPWHICEEGIYSLEKGRTHYTSNSGLMPLREEISAYMKRHYDCAYDPEHEILITVGGSEAIDLAMRVMVCPKEEVIIPQPSYVSYEPCVTLTGGHPVIVNLKAENEFKLTGEELRAAITDRTKCLILPFPNNPTGSIMTKEELQEIADICIEKDIIVVSDEIYSMLTYGEENHCSIASLPGMKERTIVINGFSKSHAMTGWRLGYACGPRNIIEQMLKIHQYAIMCAPTTSQFAAVEAIKNGDKDVERMRQAYDQRRKFLIKELNDMGLETFEAKGAFYVFPSIQSLKMTSEEFATRLLYEEKVAVVPGTAFGDCGEGFLRISYAYSIENIKVALDRIRDFVQRRRAELEGQ